MNDWKCRNCGMRFVPTYWVAAGYGIQNAQCIRCESNATEEIMEDDKNE